MKSKLLFLFCILTASTRFALAEGGGQRSNGDFGLNRRVRTEPNFTRVAGDIFVDFRLRTVRGTIATVSTPSFYLGGRGTNAAGGTVEVDAGLDYDNGVTTGTFQPGWVPFIARSFPGLNQKRVNPRSWKNGKWEVTRRLQGNDLRLDYAVDSQGRIRLTVNDGTPGGVITFYWLDNDINNDGIIDVTPAAPPPAGVNVWPYASVGENVIDPATLNQYRVKRVLAVTQPANPANPEGTLDGTTLKCLFSNGTLYTPNGTKTSWTATQTSQVRDGSGTGYDAPQTGLLAEDAIWNGHRTLFSKERVLFPKVSPQTTPSVVGNVPRTNSVQSQNGTESGVSRYSRETVNLNLRAFPVGYTTFKF